MSFDEPQTVSTGPPILLLPQHGEQGVTDAEKRLREFTRDYGNYEHGDQGRFIIDDVAAVLAEVKRLRAKLDQQETVAADLGIKMDAMSEDIDDILGKP